jgi:hypothetical protein
MSALQVLIDGFFTAAELVALLFVSPVSAMEQPRTELASSAQAIERARDAHLLSSSFDVRLLGSLADVRVSQHFRNSGAETINLAGRLPSVDEHTDALRIHRKGRIVDLLRLDSGCGSDEESDENEELQASTFGRVQLAVDESIADALQLAPGETASIELIATQSLSHAGATYRLALPTHATVEAQALLVDQTDVRFLVVVPHRAARGTARLTLRPDRAAPETIELGVLSEPSIAYVVPLANRAALQALAAGAIELETRTHDGIVWSTLPAHVRTDFSLALAGASK